MGYIRNVTPTKVSKKGNQYFSFEIQQKDRVVTAVCFSPQKHKAVVESEEDRGSPCKITRFLPHVSENNTIWINPNTQINELICDVKIICANIQIYYSCLGCSKRVLFHQEKMLRCGNAKRGFWSRMQVKRQQ